MPHLAPGSLDTVRIQRARVDVQADSRMVDDVGPLALRWPVLQGTGQDRLLLKVAGDAARTSANLNERHPENPLCCPEFLRNSLMFYPFLLSSWDAPASRLA